MCGNDHPQSSRCKAAILLAHRHALAQIQLISDQTTLASAQLAVARAYGFANWPKLKAEVEARTLDLAQRVDALLLAGKTNKLQSRARLP